MSDGIKRRDFLKVLGVSGAGASMVGCSTEDVEKLIPYVVPPDDVTPGIATWYASVCQECSAGCGVWVRTREGRTVKLEGNANHPISRGNLCSRGHASLQGLYHPDRYTGPMIREEGELREAGWDEAEALLAQRIGGAGDTLLFSGRMGATLEDLADNFLSAVGGTRVEYQGLAEASLREATRIAFGQNVIPSFDFGSARFILSFGADFLETWLSPVAHARGFARARSTAGEGKAPFVVASPRLSLSGQNADEWIPVRPGSEAGVALALARILADNGAEAGPYRGVLEAYEPASAASEAGIEVEVLETLAERLAGEGPSLVVGPGVGGQHRNATAANLAVLILNAMAGNVGRTVRLDRPDLHAPARPYGEMESAIRAMAGGRVGVAMVRGTNPAYSLPPGSGFREAFGAVDFKVSFASLPDETSVMADLILPDRHFLEAWGDSNPRPGVFAIQQPTMQPLPHFDSKQTGDVLLSVAGRLGHDLGAATFYDYLRGRWERVHGLAPGAGDFDEFWRETLRRGVVEVGQEATDVSATLRSPDAALTFDPPALDGEGLDFTLVVYPSPRFGDGDGARSPWLMELPDPVSKITWHSWVEVHPDTAESLGVRDGDVVRVSSPHGELEVPVWIYPGIREDVVAIPMGLGHEELGRWAAGRGVNPMGLLPALAEQPSGALVHLATRVSVEPTGVRRRLATVEGSSDQSDRPIAMATSVASLGGGVTVEGGEAGHQEEAAAEETAHAPAHDEAAPGAAAGAEAGHQEPAHDAGGHGEGQLQELQRGGGFVPVPTDGEAEDYPLPGARYGDYANPEETPRWAMAIDLDQCTGCSACVTACQAENNVPWVGEEQVLDGREMHWIRLERYYEHVDAHEAGTRDIRHLPMLCQHCGNAPCEPVCPVFAAYHTPDGINGQVYNRCVGTRYCANNCPYKVRVFNWYTFTDVPEPLNWQYNPDVTVRDNGVMEKCTFCIQRVRAAQHEAALEGRPVMDGEVVPACQQTCPSEAIVFGDIRDPGARVHRIAESERGDRILDSFINTQPAITYQKKVTFHAVEEGGHG